MNPTPIITSPSIRNYCEQYSSGQNPLLKEIEKMSHESTSMPQMISGSFLGLFLRMICMVQKPKRVVEVGTFTGYGTLCLSEFLPEDGEIITIEKDHRMFGFGESVWKKSANYPLIHQVQGDASDILASIEAPIDLVYIDAAKKKYIEHFDLIFPKVREGGIILADNVLWRGIVAQGNKDNLGEALHLFNQYISERDDVENIILPLDDGLNFIIKK